MGWRGDYQKRFVVSVKTGLNSGSYKNTQANPVEAGKASDGCDI